MPRYAVYLEVGADGRTMAHVPELPGCISREPTRDDALALLPAAVRSHHAWLRRHGEPAPEPDAPIELVIVEESTGFGPFDPRNAAALFAPDRPPLSAVEIERLLRLAGWARADLLSLVRNLPDDILDWQPSPDAWPIRRILRHVGNAEEWYVSRLVPPETLPPEWQDDDALPIIEFLAMERRTAADRLRRLTEAERSAVHLPAGWTDHPEEPWTARKAMRRLLEHELEHTAQVQETLDLLRARLLARLAVERAGLLEAITGLDAASLTEERACGDWSVKDLLAHAAAWDRWEHGAMEAATAGATPDFGAVQDIDAANARFVAAARELSLDEVLAELGAAQSAWMRWLRALPPQEFFRWRSYDGYDWSFHTAPLQVQWEHDAAHAGDLGAWRRTLGAAAQATWHATGPKSVLLAALRARREALLAYIALVPPSERGTRPVCGAWTLRDVVGHIADWEELFGEVLSAMLAGRPPAIDYDRNVDAWNARRAAARSGQPWDRAWADFESARRALLGLLDGLSDADLNAPRPGEWGGTPYRWAYACLDHDREHTEDLRKQWPSFVPVAPPSQE